MKCVRGTVEVKTGELRLASIAHPMGPARPRDAHEMELARYGCPFDPHGSYFEGPPPAPRMGTRRCSREAVCCDVVGTFERKAALYACGSAYFPPRGRQREAMLYMSYAPS